jgi:hypothetical protein
MNDQVLVREGDSGADLAKEVESFGRVQAVGFAISGDGLAVHVFHDEVGETVVGRPAIDEPRDVGVIELCENLPFVAKTAENVLGVEPAPDELDRDFLSIFIVGSRREIDCPQTAPADFANNLVSAKLTAHERLLRRLRKQIPRHF